MKVKIPEARDMLKTAAELFVSVEEAEEFASISIDTHLHRWPRLNPFEDAVSDIEVWKKAGNDQAPFRIEAEKDGTLLLDCRMLAPSLKIKDMHDTLEERARKSGIAALGFHNSAGVITLLPWALGLAQRDLIGLAMFNGGVNCCVPFGGTRGLFGTLPFAYAIPTAAEPVVADMAMTEIPYFQIQQAKEKGEPLPERSAVDGEGKPTTVAAEALTDDGISNLLPLGGGFKGYSLALLMEILTGSLVRSLLSDKQTPGWHPPEYGAFILAIDVAGFTDIDRFKSEVSELCRAVRMQEPAAGMNQIPVPGDRGRTRAEAMRKSGEIEVKTDVWGKLKKLAT